MDGSAGLISLMIVMVLREVNKQRACVHGSVWILLFGQVLNVPQYACSILYICFVSLVYLVQLDQNDICAEFAHLATLEPACAASSVPHACPTCPHPWLDCSAIL